MPSCCAAGFNMVGVFVTKQSGGCSAPATAEALLSSDAPGGIRTHDLRLRRRHRPATTNAGRCRFSHLPESRVGQRQPATAPLLPPLLPRVASPSLSWSSDPLYVHQDVPRTVSAPRPEASWLQGLEPRANAEGSTSEVPVVSHQRVQQLLRVLQVGGVEPLGEPPVDRCEHLSRL